MRFTLAQLEAFYWTAQLGSVNKAASHLHVAQPTISLRLRDLEHALDVVLFQKNGRGVAPSPQGQALVPRAAALLEEASRIVFQTDSASVSGEIRVGVAEGFAMICLPILLDVIRRDYPLLRPEFVINTSFELERALNEHHLDLAVLVNPIGRHGIKLLPLGIQETAWVATPHWKLGATVRPADLAQLPIVTNPPRSAMYRQIKDWFATAGLEPSRMDLCSGVAAIARLIVSGAAVGVLPVKMVEEESRAGRVRVLRSVPEVDSGRVYASYVEGGRTAGVNAMLKSIRAALSSMDYLRMDASSPFGDAGLPPEKWSSLK